MIGYCVYKICFYDTVGYGQQGLNGQKLELWASGNLTYGGAIFVANLVLLFKSNNVDGYNVLCISSGIISYFIASYVENTLPGISDLYKVFYNLFSEGVTWIALTFIVGFISVLELAHRATK